MIKLNLKTVGKLLLQTACGTGATVGAYEGLSCSEEESVAYGVGAFIVSGIALNALIPSGNDDLYRKIKKVRTEEDLENLVDDLNDDVDEDDGDEADEEPDIFDGIEEDASCSDDGDLDPVEETVVSSTLFPIKKELNLGLFEKVFEEEFSRKFRELLEESEMRKSIIEIGEKYGTDDDGYAYTPNGVRWQIPNHAKKPSRKERKEKNLLRNNQLQKKYLEHKYSRFQAQKERAVI